MALVPDIDLKRKVLGQYGRAVTHMRQRIAVDRFGLVVGAGAVVDLGFPKWGELIEGIAADDRVNGTELLANSQSQTSKAQMLYQHFRHKEAANYSESRVFNRFELWVRAKWQTVVRDCLYRDVPEDVSSLKARNKYLTAFVPLILTGDSPPFFKVGRRVLYDRAELEAWLSLRKRRSTSDHGSST